MLQKLKIVLMTSLVAMAFVACGNDDNNDNNDSNDNNVVDAGDEDAGEDCNADDAPECCNALTGETSDPMCEDGSWECEEGLDEITPGGACEQEDGDAGNDAGDDAGDDVGGSSNGGG